MTDLLDRLAACADRLDMPLGSLFEQVVKTAYRDFLQPSDYVVDVGAHTGYHMFPMAEAVGPKGKVFAFEPITRLYANLAVEIKKQGLKQVKLFNLALGDKAGKVFFSYFENQPAYSGLQQRPTPFYDDEGGLQEITVKCRLMDKKLPRFKKVSFLKLDIEGGEYRALMGCERVLAQSRPVVIFENGRGQSAKDYDYTADDFFSLFERHDMQVFLLTGEPFLREDWDKPINCWEFVALPSEKAYMAANFAGYCEQVLSNPVVAE